MMNINENSEIKLLESKMLEKTAENINYEAVSFLDEFEKLINSTSSDDTTSAMAAVNSINIPIENSDFVQYDTKEIENVDAMFFLNISNGAENMNLQINDETSVIDANNYKTMEVSKTLGDMMIKASESNRALRLDFDKEVTVVLKVSKEGKIDASFFPQNREVENYLRNNIDYLKVRFDEQNIAYSNISYKPYKQNSKNSKQGEK